ncbi:hypothetical protein BDZ97DRAFT_2075764 [Flammula alnicola]|nr:hypothetical protein BDZ97DRAFT_2075764 [Flammula alnicola]
MGGRDGADGPHLFRPFATTAAVGRSSVSSKSSGLLPGLPSMASELLASSSILSSEAMCRQLVFEYTLVSFLKRDDFRLIFPQFTDVRSLQQPADQLGWVGPPDGSKLFSTLVLSRPCGPFASEKLFNEFLLSRVEEFMWEPGAKAQADAIKAKMRDDHHIVFTHGDLGGRNILIDANANVAALIDWEMGGWMPEYWEYVSSASLSPTHDYWIPFAEQITYVDEAAMQTMVLDFCEIHGQGLW